MGLRKPSISVMDARRLSGAPAASRPAPEPEAPAVTLGAAVPEAPVPEAAAEAAPAPAVFEAAAEAAPAAADPEPAPISSEPSPQARRPADKAPALPVPAALPVLPDSLVKLQIFLSAFAPAPGVSPSFDALSQRYAPAKSLQMILRRALDEYEHMIADGTFVSAADAYAADPQAHLRPPMHTSRIMAQALVERARKHFDPLGFESARAFGFKLGTAALACFFAEEARLRRR